MRFLKIIIVAALVLALCILSLWGSLALWFRLPAPDILKLSAATSFALLGVISVLAMFSAKRGRVLAIFAIAFAGIVLWYGTIQPPKSGNWAADVDRQTTGQIDGDILTLSDVRAFAWRSKSDFTEIWEQRSYDLSAVQSVDMFLSYWAGPEIAHVIFSFGFSDGKHLAWTVEVRRQIDGGFSPIGDFFKSNTLSIIASDERDVIGVRSNIRGENVFVFPLRVAPDVARNLLEQYVGDANRLSQQPAFFNSVTSNCTTTVLRMMQAIGDPLPFDWRMVVNGYLPDYAFERGALSTGASLEQLRMLGNINPRALAHGLQPGFSQAIRSGVPAP